jgi:hypothetical protein
VSDRTTGDLPPPHNLNAERAVLGSILKGRASALAEIVDQLEGTDFYEPRHKTIYEKMVDLAERDVPIDEHTLGQALDGCFDAPRLYLAELDLRTPVSAHVAYYARKVAADSARRRLISLAHELGQAGYGATLDPTQMLDLARGRLAAIERSWANGSSSEVESVTTFPAPEDWGLATASPLAEIEYVTDLIRPGRMLLVAAVEGVGKSFARDELAVRVACAGGNFAGTWPITHLGPVLTLSEMHRDDDLRYRDDVLRALDLTRERLVGRYFHRDLMTAANGQSALLALDWRSWVIDWCRSHQVIVLFVDTVTTATGGMDSLGAGDRQAVRRPARHARRPAHAGARAQRPPEQAQAPGPTRHHRRARRLGQMVGRGAAARKRWPRHDQAQHVQAGAGHARSSTAIRTAGLALTGGHLEELGTLRVVQMRRPQPNLDRSAVLRWSIREPAGGGTSKIGRGRNGICGDSESA